MLATTYTTSSSSSSSSSSKVLLLCGLAALLAATPLAGGNAPCSLPINSRGSYSSSNACRKGSTATGPIAHYYHCSGTKAGKTFVSHNAPLASFRQPRESIDRLMGLARGVKVHVGNAVGGVKRKWAEHRESARRRAANKAAEAGGRGQGAKKKGGGGGLFRLGGVPDEEDEIAAAAAATAAAAAAVMEEEFAPGQDVKHLHEHAQHHRLLSPPGAVHPRYSQYAPNEGHVTPSPLHEDSVGPALVVMHRHYEATLGGQGQEPPRLPLKRRALTYGHWAVDLLGYGVKLVAILLFQVLGAALVVNEYQAQGLVSRALMKLSGLLAGLAFLPPVAVAVRETLPSHARNPFVRAVSSVFELALDVVCVSSVALLASILLTAVMALPGLHEKLLSYQLAEEYVKGALSAGAVMVFLWAFAKNFEALATKWFM